MIVPVSEEKLMPTLYNLRLSAAYGRRHSASHFLVGEVKTIDIQLCIILLYGKIAALVNHWQRFLLCCLIIYKFSGGIVFSCKLVDVLIVVLLTMVGQVYIILILFMYFSHFMLIQ